MPHSATPSYRLLHAAAYWLLDTLRRWLVQAGSVRVQLDMLRLTLLKIGGRVLQLGDHVAPPTGEQPSGAIALGVACYALLHE